MRLKLVEIRRNNNLTQEEIAILLGISRAHYGRIEEGERNPSLGLALNIKQLFNYENDDIFFNHVCDKTVHNDDSKLHISA